MRLLETLIVVSSFVLVFLNFLASTRTRKWVGYSAFAVDALFLVYILMEGLRWQMVPMLVIVLALTTISVIRLAGKGQRETLIKRKALRVSLFVLVLLVFVVSAAFPILLPIVDLPKPTGPYLVGTTDFSLTDPDRLEQFTSDPNDVRKFVMRVWYPTDDVEGKSVAHYWDEGGVTGKAYSQNSGMGNFWYAHLRFVKTNSYWNASLSNKSQTFPIIIYSPAFMD
jgi:predicted dienelactone hydrolase